MLRSHGRKSQHAAMVSGVADLNWPPSPPNNVSAKAQREWRDVTSNLSSGAMPRESLPLLAVWCCLKVELDDVMLGLAQFPNAPMRSEDLKRYKALIRMRTALTREFSQLSSKLRLTPAARLDAHRSQSGVSSNKPWASANKANEQEGQQQLDGQPWGESEVASEEQQ